MNMELNTHIPPSSGAPERVEDIPHDTTASPRETMRVEPADNTEEAEPVNGMVDAVIGELYSTPIWRPRGNGIFERVSSGVLYERPKIGGRFTYRSLGTKNIKEARKTKRARESKRTAWDDPASIVMGDIIRSYVGEGCPHEDGTQRAQDEHQAQKDHCDSLLEFWDKITLAELSVALCDEYAEHRKATVARGTGDRTVDHDLSTLRLALRRGAQRGLIRRMPLAKAWPSYARTIRRSCDCAPHDADDLHAAAKLLLDHGPETEVTGWQMLLEAYTGLATAEALSLRDDAPPERPGWIRADGQLYRGGETNPYILLHEGLQALLPAWRRWKKRRFPESPWYFPSSRAKTEAGPAPLPATSLVTALQNYVAPVLKRRLTSQGLRAFYVRVRRSHGKWDSQIAWELGLAPGSQLMRTYGGVPPHWLKGEGPKFPWLPKGEPAWADLLDRLERNAERTERL